FCASPPHPPDQETQRGIIHAPARKWDAWLSMDDRRVREYILDVQADRSFQDTRGDGPGAVCSACGATIRAANPSIRRTSGIQEAVSLISWMLRANGSASSS